MLSVLIGDDHPVFRRGTRDVITVGLAPVNIGEAGSGTELIALVKKQAWDVCIMDVTMPEKSGTDLLEEILGLRPTMPVLVLSMHPEKMYAIRMIRGGASGYLNKAATDPSLLIEAIRSVVAGHKFLTPSVAECLAETVQMGSAHGSPDQLLSNREFMIFEMLAVGKQIKEIAGDLCISPATVSTYRSRILQKLGLKNNADLVRYAIDRSLIA